MGDTERRKLTPVRSARSTVKLASLCLIAVAAAMIGIAYWMTPLAIVAWPPVMILAIAVVFGTPLLKSGPPVLMIDETGIYDTRIMRQPIPRSKISDIEEREFRDPQTGSLIDRMFIIKVDKWEELVKRKPLFVEKFLSRHFEMDGILLSATGLDYTTEGLRDTLRQAKDLGYYGP